MNRLPTTKSHQKGINLHVQQQQLASQFHGRQSFVLSWRLLIRSQEKYFQFFTPVGTLGRPLHFLLLGEQAVLCTPTMVCHHAEWKVWCQLKHMRSPNFAFTMLDKNGGFFTTLCMSKRQLSATMPTGRSDASSNKHIHCPNFALTMLDHFFKSKSLCMSKRQLFYTDHYRLTLSPSWIITSDK